MGGGEERRGVTEGGREGKKDEWTEVGEREEKCCNDRGGVQLVRSGFIAQETVVRLRRIDG